MKRLFEYPELCIYVVAAALECRTARRADLPSTHSLSFATSTTTTPAIPEKSPLSTPFDAPAKPVVSILDYVTRIAHGAHASTCVLVTALFYMQLIANVAGGKYSPTVYNVHRLFITAVTLAIKWHDDIFYSNAYYAALGGISVAELNKLELAFLNAIRFRCSANDADIADAERQAIAEACQTSVAPAIVPELERTGLCISHHHFESFIVPAHHHHHHNNSAHVAHQEPLFQSSLPFLPEMPAPRPTPFSGFPKPALKAHTMSPISAATSPTCPFICEATTSSSVALPLAMPAFDPFAGVFLAPATDQLTSDQDEEPYECHAVRMLDIEYGSVVGTSA